MSDANFSKENIEPPYDVALPKITPEIWEAYQDEEFIEDSPRWEWTQAAVDFACEIVRPAVRAEIERLKRGNEILRDELVKIDALHDSVESERDRLRAGFQEMIDHPSTFNFNARELARAMLNGEHPPSETSRDPHTELKRLRKQMGEIAVLLLQNDRDEVLQWARGVKLHFPDGAPELMPDDECICPVKSGELCPVHHRRSEKAPETPDAPCCREGHNGGFVCTLPKGHAGRHEAWGEGLTQQRYLIVHWPSEKAAPKRAYYETHDPPHCPTCSCGLPPADACSCGRVELKDGYVRATCADGSVHTKGGCNSPSKAGDEP